MHKKHWFANLHMHSIISGCVCYNLQSPEDGGVAEEGSQEGQKVQPGGVEGTYDPKGVHR